VSVQVCCFMVGSLFFGGAFSSLSNNFWFDTRRWIKSKNTLRPMLMHHRQKPIEVISATFVTVSKAIIQVSTCKSGRNNKYP
jgi:hypothetical protein